VRKKLEKLPGQPILDYGKKLGLTPASILRVYHLDVTLIPKLFPSLDNLATRIIDRIRPEIINELLLLQATATISGLPRVLAGTQCKWCGVKALYMVDNIPLCPSCTRLAVNLQAACQRSPAESYRL
jgi:hypothetical protein